MNWREIRKYTNKDLARIDRDIADKSRKSSELSNILTEGVSLFQKYTQGKADQSALETFGESEGLTYDKKSKSFYGTQDDQHYKISTAELKNMQNFSKYTDKGISDFISTKDGNIKKGFATDLSELDSSKAGDVRAGETMEATMKRLQNEMQTVGAGNLKSIGPRKVPSHIQHKRTIAEQDKKYGGDRTKAIKSHEFGAGVETAYEVEQKEIDEKHRIHEERVASNLAKENEMKKLLDIQTKNQQEFDAKVVADKKFQEDERIRLEKIENEKKIKEMKENSRWFNPDLEEENQSSMSIMFNGRK